MEKDAEEFARFGHEMIDWICDYWRSARDPDMLVAPDTVPGHVRDVLPEHPPHFPETFDAVMADLNNKVMPNVLHWMSPHFHAYFPSANSAASLLGDMVSGAINAIGFSWISNPAGTELEMHVLDWLAEAVGLPDHFRFNSGGTGGGAIISSASEATFLALSAARERYIRLHPGDNPFDIMSRLVAYTSKEAHSSVRRAGLLARCTVRLVSLTRHSHQMDPDQLLRMITEDEGNGLIPVFVCATMGTTGVCAFDDLTAVGEICSSRSIWLHVDAAYGGNAMLCPEYRYLMEGVEFVDSIVVSPHKWMMVSYDCSVIWVRSRKDFTEPFLVEPEYLKHQKVAHEEVPDYRNWHISCGRRFRSLKLWFVIRLYGISGLQQNIRSQVQLGDSFAQLVRSDVRFQIVSCQMGIVTFRLPGPNILTMELLAQINATRKIRLIHTKIGGRVVIRFVASGSRSTQADVRYALDIIQDATSAVLESNSGKTSEVRRHRTAGDPGTRRCKTGKAWSGSLPVPGLSELATEISNWAHREDTDD